MKTIFLAERNKNVREFISRELLTLGYRIRGFKNARDLLEGIKTSGRADVIVLGEDLPDMAIVDTVHNIRKNRPTQPVVLHTLDAYENGFLPDPNLLFAKKQSDLGELIAALRQC
ncbi:MAG: hypothetical protein PHO79_07425 [Desulfoplanes sp.]|nr:hypothetical protein [Desulfoplanes sp.]